MALASGLGGDTERHASEAGHVRLGDLDEFEVAAFDLVLHHALDAVDDLTVLADVELVGLAVGEKIAVADCHLLDGVPAEGQKVGCGGRLSVLDGEFGDDLTLLEGHAAADDGVLVEGLDLEAGAIEICGTEGGGQPALKVALGDLDAAARDLILCGEGVDLAVLGDRGVDVRGGDEVAAVARRLADDVLAEGQAVAGGRREALGIGSDGLDDLTLGVGDAIHRHVVVAVVDDGEGDALEAGTALRLGAGLSVELLHRHAAALDLLRDLRGVVCAFVR